MTGRAATSAGLTASLPWFGIFRLGLVQAALGSVVVLVTSTLNRVMVVEYALPAVLPGVLVALHYAVQVLRPRFGFESDVSARRTPWIIGGMAMLGMGGVLCAVAAVWIAGHPIQGLILAALAYAIVGLGVGAAGTSLLVLMAKRVNGERRAAAATLMWTLMIAGFALTSLSVGHFLDPFAPRRLIIATIAVASIAFTVTIAAIWNIEGPIDEQVRVGPARVSFYPTLRRIWSEPKSRSFTLFVFVSMLAYSAQELLLEPFAGLVFGYTLGQSAQLSGLWHASALLGMVGVGAACSGPRRLGGLRTWTMAGCIGSALALLSLAGAGLAGPAWPLRFSVMALGVANGAFAVAAIGSMMELSHAGGAADAGVRMGLWGAAQAVAFAVGGLLASAVVDVARHAFASSIAAFGIVFAIEAGLFLSAARFVAQVQPRNLRDSTAQAEVSSL